ncbi:MAG: thiamine pyrophosphate-dependent enzyme [Candidatus Omnitrophica bacterium]|nr:thiamine pyrophosphate-dependent enzyme [Candidatus Omnitrophota bacterium]
MRDVAMHYCSGCGHGIIHRLICEVIDELEIREKTIGVAPVGCAVLAYDYWNFDTTEASHGRPPAVATGIKRILPERIVFTYQGDGDLAAIGTAEIIHTANRGENITVIFVNNAVYGMTGGQMAPTTILGQKTETTPWGRDAQRDGFPLKISEMLALLSGVVYVERTAVNNAKNVLLTKKAIKKAFLNQIENKGFSLVEILSPCPTYWRMSPVEAVKWIETEMVKYYPLGVIKG